MKLIEKKRGVVRIDSYYNVLANYTNVEQASKTLVIDEAKLIKAIKSHKRIDNMAFVYDTDLSKYREKFYRMVSKAEARKGKQLK